MWLVRVPAGLEHVLSIDPQVKQGELCFMGTRVPLEVLLDSLDEGVGREDFRNHYPTVDQWQVDAVISWEQNALRQAAGLRRAG